MRVLNLFGAPSPHSSVKLIKVLCQCFKHLAAVGGFGSKSKWEGFSKASMANLLSETAVRSFVNCSDQELFGFTN